MLVVQRQSSNTTGFNLSEIGRPSELSKTNHHRIKVALNRKTLTHISMKLQKTRQDFRCSHWKAGQQGLKINLKLFLPFLNQAFGVFPNDLLWW